MFKHNSLEGKAVGCPKEDAPPKEPDMVTVGLCSFLLTHIVDASPESESELGSHTASSPSNSGDIDISKRDDLFSGSVVSTMRVAGKPQ